MCYRPSCTLELIGIDLALRLGIDWLSTQSAWLLNYPSTSKHRAQWHSKHTQHQHGPSKAPRVWQNSMSSCYPFPNFSLRCQGGNQEEKPLGCLLSFVPIAKLWKIKQFVFSKKVSPSLSEETASPLLFLSKCSSMELFPSKHAAGHQPGQTLLPGFTPELLSTWIACFAPKYKPALMKHEELTAPARNHRKTHLAESRKPSEHVADHLESRARTGPNCLQRFAGSYLLLCLLYPWLTHRLTSPFILCSHWLHSLVLILRVFF